MAAKTVTRKYVKKRIKQEARASVDYFAALLDDQVATIEKHISAVRGELYTATAKLTADATSAREQVESAKGHIASLLRELNEERIANGF